MNNQAFPKPFDPTMLESISLQIRAQRSLHRFQPYSLYYVHKYNCIYTIYTQLLGNKFGAGLYKLLCNCETKLFSKSKERRRKTVQKRSSSQQGTSSKIGIYVQSICACITILFSLSLSLSLSLSISLSLTYTHTNTHIYML